MKAPIRSVAFLVLCGGCVGSIDEKPSPDEVPGTTPESKDWGGITNPPCTVSADSGRVVAHRLSRLEYNNTVRDLFANIDVGRPADNFPDDTRADNKNPNGLTVSTELSYFVFSSMPDATLFAAADAATRQRTRWIRN